MEPVVARRGLGFTLLETLVVLAVVAIGAAFLVPTLSRSDAGVAQQEGRRLAALLQLAADEARTSGRRLAWSAEADGYAFWHRADDAQWVRFPDSSVYRARRLPAGTALLRVRVGAAEVRPGERVLLQPFGFGDALEVTVSGGPARITVRGTPVGRVSVERIHAG